MSAIRLSLLVLSSLTLIVPSAAYIVSHQSNTEPLRQRQLSNMVYFVHNGIVAKTPQNSLYHRVKRQILGDDDDGLMPETTEMIINSNIVSRFAEVTINSVINNPSNEDRQSKFQVYLPEEAFMSNFTMLINGKLQVTEVVSKEEAEKRYEEALTENKTAGMVSNEQRPLTDRVHNMEKFVVAVNVAANSTIKFTLTYNELLKRTLGLYRQRISVRPNQVVNLLRINVIVNESQGITEWDIYEPMTANSLQTQDTLVQESPDRKTLEIVYEPSVKRQIEMSTVDHQGLSGNFVIEYDVYHEDESGLIQVQNGFYVQYFSLPDDYDLILPKNIIFVIDISGSMSGSKMDKTREAMPVILNQLRYEDKFMILLFDDKVEYWPEKGASLVRVTTENINSAKVFIERNAQARGGTDINNALVLAAKKITSYTSGANMIIFLTDGDPTSGVTDTKMINNNVQNALDNKAAIFCLGFGFNMNFAFLQAIAFRNNGFAVRIYDDLTAKIQLESLYQEIGSPILSDVAVNIPQGSSPFKHVTKTDFPLYFRGSEIVIAGKLLPGIDQVNYDINCVIVTGPTEFPVVFPVDETMMRPREQYQPSFVERLYVYMRIKDLLREELMTDDETEQAEIRKVALRLALEYHMVTPLTSFLIIQDRHNDEELMEDRMLMGYSPPFQASGYPSRSSSSASSTSHHIIGSLLLIVLSSLIH